MSGHIRFQHDMSILWCGCWNGLMWPYFRLFYQLWGNCYPLELSCTAIPAPGQSWQSLGWVLSVEPVPWTPLPTPVTCGRDTSLDAWQLRHKPCPFTTQRLIKVSGASFACKIHFRVLYTTYLVLTDGPLFVSSHGAHTYYANTWQNVCLFLW